MFSKQWCVLMAVGVAVCQSASAEDVHVVVSAGLAAAYKKISPAFEKRTHHHLITEWGSSTGTTPGAIPMRLDRGEPVDVVIMVRDNLGPLIAKGQVVPGSAVDLARSKIAMAVRKGAPIPDISTVEALRRVLLNASSVAYSDNASGLYIAEELFTRLGIEDQMAGKSRKIPATTVGESVASGTIDLGFQQYSELLPVAGIHVVGLIPEELQKVTVFSAAMTSKAKAAVGGQALIQYLASPNSYRAIRVSGLEPVGEVKASP